METGAGSGDSVPATLESVLANCHGFAARLGREDLSHRLGGARSQLDRPHTIVCVVGQFKEGKSSLVNGLLGEAVCPVDDDLATAVITLVRHGEQRSATVRRTEGGQTSTLSIPIDEVDEWVTERNNPDNRLGVDRVDVTVPSPVLSTGIVLVDTPGAGGLGAGHAAATLAFLPFADGLVFVSDASAELSAPELDFLRRAVELSPTVLFAQTKIDLYPHADRITAANAAHLSERGLDIPIVGVSAALRSAAFERRDRALNEASRFPQLVAGLADGVAGPAKADARRRALSIGRDALTSILDQLEAEGASLADSDALAAERDRLSAARARIGELRSASSRWSTVLADRSSDLQSSVMFSFRSAVRLAQRSADEQLEAVSTPAEWDAVAENVQNGIASAVADAFSAIERSRSEVAEEIVELLAVEGVDELTGPARSADATERLIERMAIALELEAGSGAVRSALDTLRGAQSGMMMLGMMGRFLPGAAAALAMANPVILGAGVLFGGSQLREGRKRRLATMRQAVRTQLRQYLDDAQFEITNELTDHLKRTQREVRDATLRLLAEVEQTVTDEAVQAERNLKASESELRQRARELDDLLGEARTLVEQLDAVSNGFTEESVSG